MYRARHSPPDTGGVAALSRRSREATAAAQSGWSGLPKCFRLHSLEEAPFPTTPSAPLKEASRLFLDVASTPPVSGGELPDSHSFTASAVIDRACNRFTSYSPH